MANAFGGGNSTTRAGYGPSDMANGSNVLQGAAGPSMWGGMPGGAPPTSSNAGGVPGGMPQAGQPMGLNDIMGAVGGSPMGGNQMGMNPMGGMMGQQMGGVNGAVAGDEGMYSDVNVGGDGIGDAILKYYFDALKSFLTGFGGILKGVMSGLFTQIPLCELGGVWVFWLIFGVVLVVGGFIAWLFSGHALWASMIIGAGLAHIGGGVVFGTYVTILLTQGATHFLSGGNVMDSVEIQTMMSDFDNLSDGSAEDEGASDSEPEASDEALRGFNVLDDMGPSAEAAVSSVPTGGGQTAAQAAQHQEAASQSLDEINSLASLTGYGALYKIALDVLPVGVKDFTNKIVIEPESQIWKGLEAAVIKAIRAVTGLAVDDISSSLVSLERIHNIYTMRVTRTLKLHTAAQLKEFDDELSSFIAGKQEGGAAMVVGKTNNAPVCSTVTQGEYYVISVRMQNGGVILLGDVYRTKEFQEFMQSGAKMPICLGINAAGSMCFYDAKMDTSVMLCGQTRSGKSWFVTYYLLNFMLLKSPMEFQAVIVDPKNTALLRTLSLMPHVMGYHVVSQGDTVDKMLMLLSEFVEVEGERRKKLLLDAGVDNYWDYIAKFGKESLPQLLFFIDEFASVVAEFNECDKEKQARWNNLLKVLVTQFPAFGMRFMIVPHRVLRTVDPTFRDLVKFKATFCSDETLSTGNLGVKKVNMTLTSPGDMAWISDLQRDPMYTHGMGVAVDDDITKRVIKNLAKACYRMELEVPEMKKFMKHCCNRNEVEVVKQLKG